MDSEKFMAAVGLHFDGGSAGLLQIGEEFAHDSNDHFEVYPSEGTSHRHQQFLKPFLCNE